MKRLLFFALALSCWAVAEKAYPQELVVSAAASLTNAFGAIGGAFQKANPGVRVRYNFGASGTLLTQIDHGAPVDVFASADRETMDLAEARTRIEPGSRRGFATNQLMLVVPAAGTARLTALAGLVRPEVRRIAIGNPGLVPAGRYARRAIEDAGLWGNVSAKVVPGNSVRQVLDYVTRGEVDAGFVFDTDVAAAAGKVVVVEKLETPTPILYPIAVCAGSSAPRAARAFLDFVCGPEGQAILARYGFGLPGPAGQKEVHR